MSSSLLDVSNEDVRRIQSLAPEPPRVGIVLGSGLSALADAVDDAIEIPYPELASYPGVGEVVGHAGRLLVGTVSDVPVVLFSGRVHQYQGASALEAAFPARMAAALGCEVLLLTNAAGAVVPRLATGDIMLITDHMNLMGTNPLTGWPGPEGGNPFVPMSDAYDRDLQDLARAVATSQDVALQEGVYAGLLGPCYETPAEVAMLRTLGADVVGMSTVPEVIAARALGLRVMGLSLVTNAAAGEDLSHDEVLEAGKRASVVLTRLVLGILERL
ncbi:MAG: purine-nucleoside phosphorylase [Coriobacteriia bacterium]|nr:purine-nucleoside phosphorylase [Coriobacteriia bacterium]